MVILRAKPDTCTCTAFGAGQVKISHCAYCSALFTIRNTTQARHSRMQLNNHSIVILRAKPEWISHCVFCSALF